MRDRGQIARYSMLYAMKNEYQIELKPLHHSECILHYKDAIGELEIWVDRSPSPEYDFVSSEPDFGVTGYRLSQVLENVNEWAKKEGYTVKVWKKDELGI